MTTLPGLLTPGPDDVNYLVNVQVFFPIKSVSAGKRESRLKAKKGGEDPAPLTVEPIVGRC